MLATRFICARKSWHVDHRGEIRAASVEYTGELTRCCSSSSLTSPDRAYGKAPTFSSTDTTQFKRAIDMTDDELAAIASGATLHVVK